jgi:hypothetical protein
MSHFTDAVRYGLVVGVRNGNHLSFNALSYSPDETTVAEECFLAEPEPPAQNALNTAVDTCNAEKALQDSTGSPSESARKIAEKGSDMSVCVRK